ncbi:hypothetical protein FOPG_11851 [Fusarium oxysporum f. sp. conglutinans race 2 54008]|uniref:Uncharacterized protein n=1 Tax=Fusarium oxysporum f. sp. conglutinans race 2 54008 TaxID=1089457 RepID=X0HLM8_FUSOX|nr:hypothetical protein FOPG_11851 [Fusarium oxysporum f. sp. conglutinans race 2 54008]
MQLRLGHTASEPSRNAKNVEHWAKDLSVDQSKVRGPVVRVITLRSGQYPTAKLSHSYLHNDLSGGGLRATNTNPQ